MSGLNHRFISGSWKDFNDHKDEIPAGSIIFCEDVGKIMLRIDGTFDDLTNSFKEITEDELDNMMEQERNNNK